MIVLRLVLAAAGLALLASIIWAASLQISRPVSETSGFSRGISSPPRVGGGAWLWFCPQAQLMARSSS